MIHVHVHGDIRKLEQISLLFRAMSHTYSLCGTSLLQHLFLFLDIVVCCCMVLYILYDWHLNIYFALLQ